MQAGQTWGAVKKGDHGWMLVETPLVCPLFLKGGVGNVKRLRRLTLGKALDLSITILPKEFSTLGAIPARVVIMVASLRVLGYCAYCDSLGQSFALVL